MRGWKLSASQSAGGASQHYPGSHKPFTGTAAALKPLRLRCCLSDGERTISSPFDFDWMVHLNRKFGANFRYILSSDFTFIRLVVKQRAILYLWTSRDLFLFLILVLHCQYQLWLLVNRWCVELILTEIRYICQKYFVMSPMYGLWQLILYEWARLWCCSGVGNIWWSTGHPVYIMAELRVTKYTQSSRKWSQWTNWSFDCRECRPTAGPFMPRSLVELQTKVREDFTITEKAPTRTHRLWYLHLAS